MRRIALSILFACAALPAAAAGRNVPNTGFELKGILEDCRRAGPAADPLACRGFQAGAATAALVVSAYLRVPAPFCLPEGTTDAGIDAALLKAFDGDPTLLEKPSAYAVLVGLAREWPCPKAETPKAETPKAETPKADPRRIEAPKTEAPKTEGSPSPAK